MRVTLSATGVTVVTPDKLPALLTDGLQLDLKGVAGRFSDHAVKRVDNITRAVVIARVFLHLATDDAQIHGDPIVDDKFIDLLTTLNAILPKQLQSWAKRASGLKLNISSLVNLMVRYINLDRNLSEIEPSARRLQLIMAKWEHDYLDEIRGR